MKFGPNSDVLPLASVAVPVIRVELTVMPATPVNVPEKPPVVTVPQSPVPGTLMRCACFGGTAPQVQAGAGADLIFASAASFLTTVPPNAAQ